MANPNKPFGLRPVKHSSCMWAGQTTMYVVLAADTSDYFIGDVVMLGGSADANGVPSVIKYVAAGSGATAPLGVVVAVHPVRQVEGSLQGTSLALEDKYLEGDGTADRYVEVVDAIDVVFEVRADTTGIPRNSVGSNIDLTVAAPSNNFQLSATVLDNATDAATATLPYRIIGFAMTPDNEISGTATTANPSVVALVRPNEHAFKAGTLGLAV